MNSKTKKTTSFEITLELPSNFPQTNIGKRVNSCWPNETRIALVKGKNDVLVAYLLWDSGALPVVAVYAENEQSMVLADAVRNFVADYFEVSPDRLPIGECWHSDIYGVSFRRISQDNVNEKAH